MKYYNTNKIDKKKAVYNVIFGERSNGKTYALLLKSLKKFIETREQFAYLRRWQEDVIGRRASGIFASINENKEVEKLTNGNYSAVHYLNGKFYLCNYDNKGRALFNDFDEIGHLFALSATEHNKSISYPKVTTVIFDEFLTDRLYLPDEFILFMNTLSTIIRKRDNVKIYMLGNTVNKYNPYFQEMGLVNALKMEQGTIDIYRYGNSPLTVAVEYCASLTDEESQYSKAKYFAFNNPKLEMITGGKWQLDIYAHLPIKYKPKDILLTYFILFNGEIYQAEIIQIEQNLFTYIHLKTTDLRNPEQDLIYCLEPNPSPNYHRNILKPISRVGSKIASFFSSGKVFYQNNEVGNAITNYIKLCKRV